MLHRSTIDWIGGFKVIMIMEVRLPLIVSQMSGATVECVYAEPGLELGRGAKLVDLSVNLSSAFAQECPPISYYRIVLLERAFVRSLHVAPGDPIAVDAMIATFSNEADEPLELNSARPMRMSVAGIMHHDGMISGNQL